MKVYRQGEQDMLCGIYAIINALTWCGIGPPDVVYAIAINPLEAESLSGQLVKGLKVQVEILVLEACLSKHSPKLNVIRPFEKSRPTDHKFWSTLKTYFQEDGAIVAVQGIREPDDHWVAMVPGPDGKIRIR